MPIDSPDVVAVDVDAHLRGRHLLLLSDFDGTLADLAPTPEAAVMTDRMRRGVARLAALDSVTFGVISGRRLKEVAAKVGDVAEFVAGLHGLEIVGPDCRFRHDVLARIAPAIATLADAASRALTWCPGCCLENKEYGLTCHVRLAPVALADQALQEFAALAAPQVASGLMKLIPGAKALELLPAVDWHKGRGAEWIREQVRARTPGPIAVLYLGDDRTDEDAFEALGDEDVVIGVGPRPRADLIDWRLADPAAVGQFFEHLARLRGAA